MLSLWAFSRSFAAGIASRKRRGRGDFSLFSAGGFAGSVAVHEGSYKRETEHGI